MMNFSLPSRWRWYAMPGEGGMVMTTFPHSGGEKATGNGGFGYYFNEVWTGQEHQIAAHFIAEGKTQEGLAITRMIHDRHHPSRRNPYNEVECSDHYTRAMSSYGTFLSACGYEYHGPKGHRRHHGGRRETADERGGNACARPGGVSVGAAERQHEEPALADLPLVLAGDAAAPGGVRTLVEQAATLAHARVTLGDAPSAGFS